MRARQFNVGVEGADFGFAARIFVPSVESTFFCVLLTTKYTVILLMSRLNIEHRRYRKHKPRFHHKIPGRRTGREVTLLCAGQAARDGNGSRSGYRPKRTARREAGVEGARIAFSAASGIRCTTWKTSRAIRSTADGLQRRGKNMHCGGQLVAALSNGCEHRGGVMLRIRA